MLIELELPLVVLSRRVMQKQIKYNRLTLILPSGKTYTFGPQPTSSPRKPSSSSSRSKTRARRSQTTGPQLVGTGKFDNPSRSISGTATGTTTTTSERSLDGSVVLDRGFGSGISTPLTSVGGVSPGPGEHKGIYGVEHEVDEDEDEVDHDEDEDEPTPVTIKIKSTNFFLRLLLSGDLGFAESYMAGECEVVYTPREGGEMRGGQRLDRGYYGDVGRGLNGEKEGEELLELFKVR